eukprot:gene15134-biopygen24195
MWTLAFLKDKYANASVLLSKLNSRLASGVLTRASDFQLPYAGGVYVPDHSRVQAKEHRNVMQILPHILNDIDDDMTRLACLWISAYKIRHRKGCDPHITDAVLKRGNTVKMHKLLHVTTLIRRLGHTENFNSNFYESDHKKVKQDYQRTSKRSTTFLQEMVRKGAQRQASKMLLKELVPTSRSTSYVMASKSGSHQLGNTKRPLKVSFDVLKGNMSSSTSSEDVQMLLKNQPELKSHNLCGKLEALLLIEKCDVAACINVSNSCTFCSVPSWGEGHNDFYELQTVRASANVYNKPWFDSITVMGQENGNEVTWYAEIRLLFFCVSRVHSKKIPFMFVRWYEIVRTRDILSAFGCTRLKGTDHYDVLPLASALGRVYVVQDFKVPGQYHVSSFKWDRSPVALAADKVDAYGNNVK